MAEPPELWGFLVANAVLLVAGGVLTGLSYRAYRRYRRPPLRGAAVGFALITVGSLLELGYEVGLRGWNDLSGQELLLLQTSESLVIAAGLVVMFYALSQY